MASLTPPVDATEEDHEIFESAHRIVGPSFEKVQDPDDYSRFIQEHPAEAAVWMRHMVTRNAEEKHARELAEEHDPLTGLYNREGFRKKVEELTSHTERESDRNRMHVIIFGDIDDFGSINSAHGNLFGDTLITDVADNLFHGIRTEQGDVVGRIGGEEFAILLLDTDIRDTETVLKRIRHSVNGLNYLDDGVDVDGVGMTFGVVGINQGEDLEVGLDRANAAESAAKDRNPHKNSTVYWSAEEDEQIRADARHYGEVKFARGQQSA